MSLLAIVAGFAVREAVADGRVSEEERRVIWCVANQNNLLVLIQDSLTSSMNKPHVKTL